MVGWSRVNLQKRLRRYGQRLLVGAGSVEKVGSARLGVVGAAERTG